MTYDQEIPAIKDISMVESTGLLTKGERLKIICSDMSEINNFDASESVVQDLYLKDFSLTNFNFFNAHLSGIIFISGEVKDSRFEVSTIETSQFTDIDFKGSSFLGLKTKQVEFIDCNLSGVNFFGSDFDFTSFINCNLVGANFTRIAIVSGSKLTFSNSDLTGAVFHGVNIDKLNLSKFQIDSIIGC